MLTEELQEYTARYLMSTYDRLPIAIIRGRGTRVYDPEGREYLDFVAGIAVNILGHAHPDLVDAIAEQSRHLLHASNLYYTEPQVQLARLLIEHSFADKVFLCNSGAEANEAAIKLARRYSNQKYGADRYEIVVMRNSFHGRTMATLSATGQEKVQKSYDPLVPGFTHVPFNDAKAVEKALTQRTAAVLLEPIQGEGGVNVADPAFLQEIRRLCDHHDVLLIMDEIQTGMGRTGTLFAHEQLGIHPDIMTLAKGLGGGIPIGACLATDAVATAFGPGSHASTFGGNPLACAAAVQVLSILTEGRLLEQSRRMGEYLHKGLVDCKDRIPLIQEVRGLGLLQGVELTIDGKSVIKDCLARRILLNCTMDRILRITPPLIITQQEIDRLLDVLSQVLNKRL